MRATTKFSGKKARIRPLATQKSLNRSSPKLARVITSRTSPGMQNFILAELGISEGWPLMGPYSHVILEGRGGELDRPPPRSLITKFTHPASFDTIQWNSGKFFLLRRRERYKEQDRKGVGLLDRQQRTCSCSSGGPRWPSTSCRTTPDESTDNEVQTHGWRRFPPTFCTIETHQTHINSHARNIIYLIN